MSQFDNKLFSASIQAKLLESRLSLREAAKESGISLTTLSRLANGKVPDIETFSALVTWLELDTNIFFGIPQKNTSTENGRWTWLYHDLLMLDVPKELIDAIVTIIKLVRKPVESEMHP